MLFRNNRRFLEIYFLINHLPLNYCVRNHIWQVDIFELTILLLHAIIVVMFMILLHLYWPRLPRWCEKCEAVLSGLSGGIEKVDFLLME